VHAYPSYNRRLNMGNLRSFDRLLSSDPDKHNNIYTFLDNPDVQNTIQIMDKLPSGKMSFNLWSY